MKLKKNITLLAFIAAAFVFCTISSASKSSEKPALQETKVGVFDSRAIAVAYARSPIFSKMLKQKTESLNKAKKEGNTEMVKQLESWGPDQQKLLHKQAFGTASVDNLLKHIKSDIPRIAKQAGVNIIVSKWDIVYSNKGAKTIDVTNLIIKGFKPDEKTIKTINELKKQKPLKDEILNSHDH